jgi:hypothetical protein
MEAMHVYHLTIQENGHSSRFVYENRDEALTRFADAIAAGLDAKLDEVVRAPALPKPTERLPDEIMPVRHQGELWREAEMAGTGDFTAQEWATLRRAVVGAAMLTALSDGGPFLTPAKLVELSRKCQGSEVSEANELVRALAEGDGLAPGFDPGATAHDVRGPALDAIRSAAAIVAWKTPRDAASFKAFIIGMAEASAESLRTGTPRPDPKRVSEASAALVSVRNALG